MDQEGYLNGPNQPWGRAQGHYQGHMGSFNPITGQCAQEPAHPDHARYMPTLSVPLLAVPMLSVPMLSAGSHTAFTRGLICTHSYCEFV